MLQVERIECVYQLTEIYLDPRSLLQLVTGAFSLNKFQSGYISGYIFAVTE